MIDKAIMTTVNLVPDTVNTSPDYFCTWQVQLYRCNNGGPQQQRDNMTEANVFGSGDEVYDRSIGAGWAAHLYKEARRDMIYLMDDSWDVPIGDLKDKSPWYASQILAQDKFPSFYGSGEALDGNRNREAMKKLAEKVKSLGWRGIGGWICIEKSPLAGDVTDEEFWSERLKWADYAGWLYWKIDWGRYAKSYNVRRLITDLRHKLAPNLIAEHALTPDIIPYADSYRTYDVFTLLAIPITLEKLAFDFQYDAAPGYLGYINCMDEVYIAAALGCAIDVTRHNMRGNLPNGKPDPSFPALHRNLKTKTDEVVRTVRWHRIAPAFSVNGSETYIDPVKLDDNWNVVNQESEIEAWWKYKSGDFIERSATARISRGLPPAEVVPDKDGYVPYIVSALHPCGAASIATLGRCIDRRFFNPLCDVTLDVKTADTIGVFGYYNTLKLLSTKITSSSKIYMQDLMDDHAYNITQLCTVNEGNVVIPGRLITEIGTSCNHDGDTSEPGLIIKIFN